MDELPRGINYKELAEKIDRQSRQSRGRASEGDWQQGASLSESGPGVLPPGGQQGKRKEMGKAAVRIQGDPCSGTDSLSEGLVVSGGRGPK